MENSDDWCHYSDMPSPNSYKKTNVMTLDDTDLFIKDSLESIISGKLHDKFTKEQLDKMLELSFLYNHITIHQTKDSILFEYGKTKISINNLYSQYSDLVYQLGKEEVKNMILSTITNQEDFKKAFKSFLRDNKINDILSNDSDLL